MGEWIEERGTVTRVDADQAWVRVERQSTCSGCQARSGCGNGLLANLLGRRELVVAIPRVAGLEPGDAVVLGIRDDALVTGALVMYLFPLGGLILLPALATWLVPGLTEPWVVGAGVLGLAVGLLAVRRGLRRLDRRLEPVLLERSTVRLPTVSAR